MKSQNKSHAKHQNQVRIIGGELRGRKITFADAQGLRPTADSVRERLFNWLGQDLTGKTVLDVFSGSGALAFESVSRHAKKAVLCDNFSLTIKHLKDNARTLGIHERVEIYQQDGLQFLAQTAQRFDVVFLDPPFAFSEWEKLFSYLEKCLNPDAYIYLEAGKLPNIPNWLSIHREGRSGQSQFVLLLYVPNLAHHFEQDIE